MKKNLAPQFIATAIVALTLSAPAFGQGRAVSQGTRVESTVTSSGAGTAEAVITSGAPDGIARINGKLHYIREGKATLITGQFRLLEGITVERNGDIILRDGRKMKVTEGRMISTAGELRDVPPNIELPQPLNQPTGGTTNRAK